MSAIASRQVRNTQARIALGLCRFACGRPHAPGITMCAPCAEKERDRKRKRLERGLCRDCGKPALPHRALCLACRDRARATKEQYVARGACYNGCKRPVKDGCRYCIDCLKRQSDRSLVRKYGIDRKEWERLRRQQGDRDPITGTPLNDPCVDHCAACGAVRALLNDGTNRHIGHLLHSPAACDGLADDLERWPWLANGNVLDTPSKARAAASYLREHQRSCPEFKHGSGG